MAKVTRGRWSTKVNVLKQDRVIYEEEGYAVGFHDARYGLGKYVPKGSSEQFYKDYLQGYKDAYGRFDSKGFEKGLDKDFERLNKQRNAKNDGCLIFIVLVSSAGLVNLITKLF